MNRYFLLIACLQLIKEITPVNPLTTWAPLIVIFGITAVKELVDDLGRRRADVAANSRTYDVVRGSVIVKVPSEQVLVGDILRLTENEEIPCDMVLLSTSDPLGNCFIQVGARTCGAVACVTREV
jgi:phospholipid-translocating ATPase